VVAVACAISAVPAHAGDVRIFGDRYDLNVINNFYNAYGHSSQILGTMAGANLAGIELLWAVQPADVYSLAEISTMSNYLANGGRIAFMGEHGSYAPTENNNINAALTSLGANISIVNVVVDGGFRTASVGDGQILAHPLTTGVNSYQYAAFAPLTISGSAQALMIGEDDPGTIMMAYQNIGPGSVFLITDQNVWDNSGSLWPSHDNEVMFDNLVSAVTGAPPVTGAIPEPSTWAMLLLGFGFVGGAMRSAKRRQKIAVSYA
jgi:hypothetical protein